MREREVEQSARDLRKKEASYHIQVQSPSDECYLLCIFKCTDKTKKLKRKKSISKFISRSCLNQSCPCKGRVRKMKNTPV